MRPSHKKQAPLSAAPLSLRCSATASPPLLSGVALSSARVILQKSLHVYNKMQAGTDVGLKQFHHRKFSPENLSATGCRKHGHAELLSASVSNTAHRFRIKFGMTCFYKKAASKSAARMRQQKQGGTDAALKQFHHREFSPENLSATGCRKFSLKEKLQGCNFHSAYFRQN